MRSIRPLLEPLEPRTLLSAAPTLTPLFTNIGHAGPEAPVGGLKHPAAVKRGVGRTLTVTATAQNTVEVGFFPSAVIDGSHVIAASIDWGDGTTASAGTLVFGTENGRSGYQIFGTHAYANARRFKISTTVTSTPSNIGPISATPIRLLARITSRVTVVAPTSVTDSGVVLHEATGESFTATLGSITTIAPASNIKATVLWGDGTTSTGTLTATGATGIDVLHFDVGGTHAFAQSGTYSVTVTITRTIRKHTTTLSAFKSSVVVAAPTPIVVAGTFTGTYTVPALVPDIGVTDNLTGSGTASGLGAVTLTGSMHRSGLIFPPSFSGTLTLTTSQGSVTLTLTSPLFVALDSTTTTLTYLITGGTGAFVNTSASGSATLTLTPGATLTDANTFSLVLT